MPYTTITTEGGLLPTDILDAVAAEELPGQRAEDFGLEKSRRLGDEIAAAWGDIRVFWDAFQRGLRRLRESDTATSITREQWMIPFLRALGYELKYLPSAAVVEGRTYAISHRAGQHDDAPPVHVEGIRTSLDARPPAGRPRLSPHALVQEYLNSTEHVWGVVTNGERLRLLRDSSRMTRPAYVEFDLRAMLEGEKFSEFALLYRLLHRSRLPHSTEDATTCLLERYHQQAVEAGGRVREKLRDGVEQALKLLGNGVLQHPANAALREKFAAGTLTPLEFYRQLLRLVYRLLFLMVAEERNLIAAEEDVSDPLSPLAYRPSANDRLEIYRQHYSIARLRRMAEQRGAGRGPYDDLWLGLMQTFQILEGSDEESPRKLGLAPLDGDLFSQAACEHLTEGTRMRNAELLQAIGALSLYREKQSRALRRVNYAALDVEELGSVYESLLDYRPVIQPLTPGSAPAAPGEGRFAFDLVTGTERKTTGSYYTRPELVHELIKSALDPVIEDRLKDAGPDPKARERALLALRVVDPAAGSGHFLLAAARRIGRALAKVRSGEEQPTPTEFRKAVRDVIQYCIYGVDLNPLAVDLCKLALWIEGHNAGMPLSFLDHHIKQGNSLIGATRALVDAGIPDDAYKAVTGDDKKVASEIKKRNKGERELAARGYNQPTLFDAPAADGVAVLADELRRVDAMAAATVAEVRAKAARYQRVRAGAEAEYTCLNLWTAAFFQPLTPESAKFVPTTKDLLDHQRRPKDLTDPKVAMATVQANEVGFFHWELEFPQVFRPTNDQRPMTNDQERSSGFDVVLGNPPWERIKLQEQEHWVDVAEVRDAANKAAREKMIQAWRNGDERQRARVALFDAAKHHAEAESRFVRASQRFPLTAVGDVNTYALFAEHARDLLAPTGRAGIIVPTGIATDDPNKRFFGSLVNTRTLHKLYDFENRERLFPDVAPPMKFCLLTLGGYLAPSNAMDFLFLATRMEDLKVVDQHFFLTSEDIMLLNPNTRTCAPFRTRYDAELTLKIYKRVPVLVDEIKLIDAWQTSFNTMFHMSGDSDLFRTLEQLLKESYVLERNRFSRDGDIFLPLYEPKLFHQYNHRYNTFEGIPASSRFILKAQTFEMSRDRLRNPLDCSLPRYWVNKTYVDQRLENHKVSALISYRNIVRVTTDRLCSVFSLLPCVATNHGAILLFSQKRNSEQLCLLANLNSLVVDYMVRQKLGGSNLSNFIVKQLPVLPPSAFTPADIAFIVPRVLELVYTAWDMRPFAEDVWNELTTDDRPPTTDRRPSTTGGDRARRGDEDLSGVAVPVDQPEQHRTGLASNTTMRAEILRRNAECNADAPADLFAPRDGFVLPPFRWSDERRALLRAELDARIARLYGLTRDELRYILDPADVYGPDFPGETFRVLKEKETKLYGEYRTRRLVLEAWDRENER